MGNHYVFSTNMLDRRIAVSAVLKAYMDLFSPLEWNANIRACQSRDDDLNQKQISGRYLKMAERNQQLSQIRTWRKLGHGKYYELRDEKEFFDACKNSGSLIVHFYKDNSRLCEIFDYHLQLLCSKHLECRFLKMNAEKYSFLAARFQVVIIPTIVIIQNNEMKDSIEGSYSLGNREDFSTHLLKWRIAVSGVLQPPRTRSHLKDTSVVSNYNLRNRKVKREKKQKKRSRK